MKTEETPTEEATFVFSMRPVISSDGGGGRRREDPFGPFYVDEELPPYNRFTLEALKESGEYHKISAVQAAIHWMETHSMEIFRTVFLLKYAEEDVRKALRLVRLEVRAGDEIHLILKETEPGSAPYEIRKTLQRNAEVGGDTWECGDWGDVMDPQTGAKLRVSLSQFIPDWVPPLPPIPPTAVLYT
jgi:hypothetical protein